MTDRQTVATRDPEGKLRWFPVEEALRWPGNTMDAGDMYRSAGQWLLLPTLAERTGPDHRR